MAISCQNLLFLEESQAIFSWAQMYLLQVEGSLRGTSPVNFAS